MLFATDEFFGSATNLLKPGRPVPPPDLATCPCSKQRDGWCTRRRRTQGNDWALVKLGTSTKIEEIAVDTSYYERDFAPKVSIWAATLHGLEAADFEAALAAPREPDADADTARAAAAMDAVAWTEIVPAVELKPGNRDCAERQGAATRILVDSQKSHTHLRLNLHPDGGIARLRVFGVPDSPGTHRTPHRAASGWGGQSNTIDVAAIASGARAVGYSKSWAGNPNAMLLCPPLLDGAVTVVPASSSRGTTIPGGAPDPGLLTAVAGATPAEALVRLAAAAPRRPDVTHREVAGSPAEWAVVQLGARSQVHRVEIVNEAIESALPNCLKIEGCSSPTAGPGVQRLDGRWHELLPKTRLAEDRRQFSAATKQSAGPVTHVRLTLYPGGNVGQLRVWGTPVPQSTL